MSLFGPNDNVPKPAASPKPRNEVSEDLTDGEAIPETPTGKFRALEAELKQGFKVEKIYTVAVAGLALVISLLAVIGAYRLFLNDAKAQTKDQVDAGLLDQQRQINAIKEEQKALKDNQVVVLVEVRELRKDLQESYKASRYDRPSPRLEAPLPPLPELRTTLDGGR